MSRKRFSLSLTKETNCEQSDSVLGGCSTRHQEPESPLAHHTNSIPVGNVLDLLNSTGIRLVIHK